MSAPLSLRDLGRATLARQLLLERASLGAVEAAAHLAGLQAQEAKPPHLGLWSRLEGFERGQLQGPLRERTLVRAPYLRGTLHITTAQDYAAIRPLLAPLFAQALKILGDRGAGLDVTATVEEARTLLADGPLTFTQLRAALLERFPEVNERALGFAVRTHLPLVMVPTDDEWGFPNDAAFTPAQAWLGEPPASATAQDLVRRYLAAYGPATAADVQAWSGLQGLAPVVRGMRDELTVLTTEAGREVVDLPDAPRPGGDVPAPLRLLPDFDTLVLGHQDRTRLLPEAYRPRIVTKNLRVRAVVLWDGLAVGTWSVARKRGVATMTVEPFEALPRTALRALDEEGTRLLEFAEPGATSYEVRVGEPA